jgi:hypothetical protein
MLYKTQDYWVCGLFRRPVFWKLHNTTFRKLDLFLLSGEGGDTYPVGSLPWTLTEVSSCEGSHRIDVSPPHLMTETDPVFETLCSLVFQNIGRWTKSKYPTILSVNSSVGNCVYCIMEHTLYSLVWLKFRTMYLRVVVEGSRQPSEELGNLIS